MKIAMLHPGAMGAGVAATLVAGGHRVGWVTDGRSAETTRRATDAGLTPVGSLAQLVNDSELVVSLCPPHAAVAVADEVAATGFAGRYLDANAISPTTATEVATIVARRGAHYIDGAVIGPPPSQGGTRLYLAGTEAPFVAQVFDSTSLDTANLGPSPTAASALKMTYAAWSKGTAALILAIQAAARHHGVDDALSAEWERSAPELLATSERAVRSAMTKGWRWIGEMEEVAATLDGAGLPDGFASAAAEVYRRVPRRTPAGDATDLAGVLDDLTS